jgi:hypothetical protein
MKRSFAAGGIGPYLVVKAPRVEAPPVMGMSDAYVNKFKS